MPNGEWMPTVQNKVPICLELLGISHVRLAFFVEIRGELYLKGNTAITL